MPRKAVGKKKNPSAQSRASSAREPDPKTRRTIKGKNKMKQKKTPRTRKPKEMSLGEWQTALRREFGREQDFKFKNIGEEPIFSEFIVSNPETGMDYRVAVRGKELGRNFCSCPDFAVNTLGTCKHIEFLLKKLERKRGGKMAFREGFKPDYSEVYLRYGAGREVVFSPSENCSGKLWNLVFNYFDDDSIGEQNHGVLRRDSFSRFSKFLKEAKRLEPGLRCYDDALAFIAQVRDDQQRVKRIDKEFPKGTKSVTFKKLLRASLYDYQREGALFAARAGRALLADDMGLGKTIQAIAAAEILAKTASVERVLIICPTSLKYQWEQEIEKFCKRSALVVEGAIAKRSECYDTDSFYKITNYDVIYRDLDLIRRWEPDLIILDEAQRIKNWKTRTAQSVKKLESQHAIVLTGTPLENRLEELHSIVEFVDRFRLGPSFRFLAEHQHTDDHGRVIGYRNLSKISKTLKSILVRREKKQVLKELPERLEKRFFVPMTEQQMHYHDENKESVSRLVNKWRRFGFLTEKEQRILMICMQNMRMSCNSTYLLDQKTDFGVKTDELLPVLDDFFSSNGAKVVIFSQWKRTHDLIINRLQSKEIDHVFFHGGVPSKKRKDLVQRFKTEPDCRVFLSTDAGGVGLNLQNASCVVNMDQPWNPAVLEQRIGRVHRLGQRRPVQVVDFIAQGTIEHGMLDLLKFKKSMFAGVLDGGEDEVFLGGTKFKRFMETVEKSVGEIPKAMPAAETPDAIKEREKAPSAAQGKPTTRARLDSARKASAGERQTAGQSPTQQQALADIVTAGISFLEKLGQALATTQDTSPPKTTAKKAASRKSTDANGPETDIISPFVSHDAESGQPYLKFPMPEPETLKKVADFLSGLSGK